MKDVVELLNATAFQSDEKVRKAKQSILETLRTYQKKLTAIRPPRTSLVQSYEKTLKAFVEMRGMPLFYPYLGSGFGNGALVELEDGSVKYDLISGIGTHWGHGHPDVVSAMLDSAIQDIAIQGHLMQNHDSFELSKLLVHASGLDHCFLTSSGAMANENALKLVFHHKPSAHRVLAFEHCFTGRTLTLGQITDKPDYREGLPLNFPVDYIPFYDAKDPEGSTKKAVAALEKHIKRYPKEHGCMCFELIQGEAGCYPGSREFFMALIHVLRKHGILVFVDEVQTFGRGDHLFAFQHFQLHDFVDVVTAGKLLQACAVLFKTAIRPKPGILAQTFTAATSSIRASIAIVKSLTEGGYLGSDGKNMNLRSRFILHLERIAAKHPEHFEGPFGYGLMIAATPFRGVREMVLKYIHALFHAGIIAFIAGSEPTRVRFLPPAGSISEEDIDRACDILEKTLIQVKEGE